jgi:glycosyltransferase involved in cell wall biosynthesis
MSADLSPSTFDTLKVGIDGRCLANSAAGISRYVTELSRALNDVLPDAQFYIYSLKPIHVAMPSKRWTVRGEPSAILRRLFRASTTTLLWLRYRVGRLCQLDHVNVFWGAQSFLPRLPANVRTLATVYDLNLTLAAGTMRWRSVVSQSLLFNRSLAEASAIFTISFGTAKRLQDLLGYKAEAVIKPAASARFKPRSQDEVLACLNRYGIRRPFLMALGTWEPRKNLAMLVETFVGMKSSGLLADIGLILVGARGWRDVKLAAIVRKAAESGVLSLGYVSDEDLPLLYSGCAAFVFPSIYEGFGIPVLEARRCGARVVATDLPEIREAGDDDTIYIEPTSDGIREGIMRALGRQDGLNSMPPGSSEWMNRAATLARLLRGEDYNGNAKPTDQATPELCSTTLS